MKMTILKRMPLVLLLVVVLVLEGGQWVQAEQIYNYKIMEKGDGEAHTSSQTIWRYGYDFYMRGMCYTGKVHCYVEYFDAETGQWDKPGVIPAYFNLSETESREEYYNFSGNVDIVRCSIHSKSIFKSWDSGSIAIRILY